MVKDFHTTLESILRKLLPQEVLSAFKNAAVLHRLLLEAQSSRLLLHYLFNEEQQRKEQIDRFPFTNQVVAPLWSNLQQVIKVFCHIKN